MKKLAVLFLLLPVIGLGQFTYTNSGDSIKLAQLGSDVSFYSYVKNTSLENDLNLRWRITENTFPHEDWEDFMCDYLCYTENTRWRNVVIPADSNFLMIHHIKMKTEHGTGTSTVCFFDPADSAGTVQCKTYSATSDTTLSISDQLSAKPALGQNFPNPFTTSTTIPCTVSSSTGALHVLDLTGKTIRRIALTKGQHEVVIGQNLEAGLYFVTLFDGGKRVDSKRMQVIR